MSEQCEQSEQSENIHICIQSPLKSRKPIDSQKPSRKRFYLILASILILLVSSLGIFLWKTFFSTETLYVAVVGPMSKPNGEAMVLGVDLALKQINRESHIHGKRIELLKFDDNNDSTLATEKAEEIVNSKAVAVIGHYASDASLAGAKVYKQHGIPAITGSATADELTLGNDWYFRVIFNNRSQGALVAHYVYKILGYDKAYILFDQDNYGSNLKDAFLSNARTIGLKIQDQWGFAPNNPDSFNQKLTEMVETLDKDQAENAILFLATHSNEAAQTLIHLKRQRVDIPIMGADALSSKTFADKMKKEIQEQYQPGYYTDGIYLTTQFLPDIAGKRAVDFKQAFLSHYGNDKTLSTTATHFKRAFMKKYQKTPSTTAAIYYDATRVVLQALTEKPPAHGLSLGEKREQLKDNLWQFSGHNSAVDGVTGPIYFDKNGDVADKQIPVGVFEKGKPTVAWHQYWPRTWTVPKMTPEILKETLADVFEDRLTKINGQFRRKAEVVYVGFEFNDISQLETKTAIYMLDFYLWFRFKPDNDKEASEKGRFRDRVIEFVNIVNPKAGKLQTPEDIEKNLVLKSDEHTITEIYRIKAQFRGNFAFHHYPLDRQILPIQLRHKEQTRDSLIFAADTQGMRLGTQMEKIKTNNVFSIHGWQIRDISFFEDIQETDSTFGKTKFFHSQHQLKYSRLNVAIEIERHVVSFFWKNLFPNVLLILMGYGIFFIKAFPTQVALGVNLILPTSILHIRLSSELPALAYFTMLEYVFYLIYFLAVFSLALAVLMHVYDEKNDELKARINRIGKISYPVIVVITVTFILTMFH
jgi:branched-chain amino acid transport system substrate-binding protein